MTTKKILSTPKSSMIQHWIDNNQIKNIHYLSDQQLSDFYDIFIELLPEFQDASTLHPSDSCYIRPNEVYNITLAITNDQFKKTK